MAGGVLGWGASAPWTFCAVPSTGQPPVSNLRPLNTGLGPDSLGKAFLAPTTTVASAWLRAQTTAHLAAASGAKCREWGHSPLPPTKFMAEMETQEPVQGLILSPLHVISHFIGMKTWGGQVFKSRRQVWGDEQDRLSPFIFVGKLG